MTGSKSRKRITVIASTEGVDRAEKALIRLGFESKTKFAEAQLLARNAVTKFFNRQPVQPDTFKHVCDGLKLDWQEILDSESRVEIGQSEETVYPEVVEMSATAAISETVGTTLAIARRQVTVLDHQQGIKARIVLEGDISSVDANFKSTLEVLLKCYGGDTIEIIDIQAGSIRITIQGSEQDVERLRERVASGDLTQINNLPIEAIEILDEEPLETFENTSSQTKWYIVQAIRTYPHLYQLVGVDLSDANLRYANLSGINLIDTNLSDADLSGTNLSGAGLSGTNLHHADLSNAILSRANLSGADLSGTNLSRADLSGTNLSGADLSGADLGDAILSGADLSGTNLSSADLNGADLSGADLSGTNLSGADLGDAILSGADLSGTNLSSADLNGADLSGADLSGTNLSGTNLSGTNLSGADLRGTNLSDAILSDAILIGADLRGAVLSVAVLSVAMVQDARFGEGIGLSQEEKKDLARRGAIFSDDLGDRELAYY